MSLVPFIKQNWSRLGAGKKFTIRASEFLHPSRDPSFRERPGWPVGQTCDYVASVTDGSRVHAQCFTQDGEAVIRVHRDEWDPDHSLGNFIKHALFETPAGPILGALALIAIARKA